MNIFVLDKDPKKAAEYHCDKHVVKMIVESAQMLSTTHRLVDSNKSKKLYKATHINHPCNVWLRKSKGNYQWTYELFESLLEEYTKRYNKIHSTSRLKPLLKKIPSNLKGQKRTKFALAMPEYCKTNCPVESYRNLYIKEKFKICNWKIKTPEWFVSNYGK